MTQRNRQLAAIVFTDIVGYSALMRQDERLARQIRVRHRAVFDTLTPKYGGRILQYYGDGTLSIFNSTVAAVECAVEMQREFQKDPVVPLRIGIHTGDIIYDDIELYGDGVNVASRIEPCCISGGIFITGKVFDDIKNHDWLSASRLGAFTFKGLDVPIDLYAIDNDGISVPTEQDVEVLKRTHAKLVDVQPEKKTLVPEAIRQVALISIPLLLLGLILLDLFDLGRRPPQVPARDPDGPTAIAVLPFENFSNESENEYFSDGMTEEILTLLSKIEGLRVVSRTSVMQYKNTDKDAREISRELNAGHILEGSVRRNGNKVRIAAQLIDARNDLNLWAETYDREITEIFEVQSQVAQAIAGALQKQLSEQEKAEIAKKPTQSVEAYEFYLKGREQYVKYTREGNNRAIQLFRKAIGTDPDFALAYAGLGDALAQKAFKQEMDPALLDSAVNMSEKAIQLDSELSEGYKALGLAYHYQGWYDRALEEYFKAVDRNSNNDMAINNIGVIYQERGNMSEAIRWARKALHINPQHSWTALNLAKMYQEIGADERAIELIEERLQIQPDFVPYHKMLAYIHIRRQNWSMAKEEGLGLIASHPDEAAGYEIMGDLSLYEGKYQEAEAFIRQAARFEDGIGQKPSHKELYLGFIELKRENRRQGRQRLQSLLQKLSEEEPPTTAGDHYATIAVIYSLLGEEKQSLDWMERAIDHHWMDYRMALTHPLFENLRQHDRFRRMLIELKARLEKIQTEVLAVKETELII